MSPNRIGTFKGARRYIIILTDEFVCKFFTLLRVGITVEEGDHSAASTEDSSEKMVVSVSAGDLILFESDQDENSEYSTLSVQFYLLAKLSR